MLAIPLRSLALIGLLIICITISAIADNHRIYGSNTQRIALLPFKINAAEDLSFLRDGIYDMFISRLSSEGRVEVISRTKVEEVMKAEAESGTLNEAATRRIGSSLNADFVLYGSLTIIGDNVSIDANMVDITGSQPTMTFFDQSRDLGAVIAKINLMAADVSDKMFGRRNQAAAKASATAQPRPTPKAGINTHPGTVLKEDGFISQSESVPASSGIFMPAEARPFQAQFWKSANFKHLIHGISLGDVDGDGKIETVTISPHAVIIYRSKAGRIQKLQELPAGSKNLTGVDIADINANGYAEIFLTSLNANKNALVSMVLEYDGKNFVKIVDDSPWFYRVADTPARGKILFGQRSKIGKHHSGKIYEMTWQNDEYAAADQIKTPRNTNLLGLIIADVLNNGQETAVAYKQNDHIQVFDYTGNIIWEGSDRYGGSTLYYSGPKEDLGDVENRIYLPVRLLVRHGAAGRESRVITVKNHELSDMKLQYRQFTKSHIEAFTWDGIGLAPKWKTRTISGYIQDFAIDDFDNDGQDELVAAMVLEEGGGVLMAEPKSTMIAIELSKPEKPE